MKNGEIAILPLLCGYSISQEVLDLRNCKFSKQDIVTIAEAIKYRLLPSVNEIILDDSENVSGQLIVLLSSKWNRLKRLNLEGCKLTLNDMAALGKSNSNGDIPCLQKLVLEGNNVVSYQLALLFTHAWLSLEDLSLRGCDLTCIDAEALDQANQLQHLPRLKKLNLEWCKKLSGQGLTALLSHTWSTLQELVLRYCSLTSADGNTLLEACRQGRLPQLSKLDISCNDGISGAGLSSLLSHTWSTLQELDMSDCSLKAADCDTLLEAGRQGRLPQLSKLNISCNGGISGAGLSSLLSHTWSTLKELDLGSCSLKPADCDTLLEACRQGRLPQLSKLNISWNDSISGAGLSSLLSHTWSTLQELDLHRCSLTAADCNTLLEACRQGRLPQLSKLNISWNNGISGAGLSSLLSNTWPTLQELDLSFCSLTAADCNTLLEAGRQGRPQLSMLNISGNYAIPFDIKYVHR